MEMRDKEYLGDGVYMGHDGYHIMLEVNGSVIFLEPQMPDKLNAYYKRMQEKYSDKG